MRFTDEIGHAEQFVISTNNREKEFCTLHKGPRYGDAKIIDNRRKKQACPRKSQSGMAKCHAIISLHLRDRRESNEFDVFGKRKKRIRQ